MFNAYNKHTCYNILFPCFNKMVSTPQYQHYRLIPIDYIEYSWGMESTVPFIKSNVIL